MISLGITGDRIRMMLLHRYLGLLDRLLLGGIFIFAGIAKVPHVSSLIWEVKQYRILPEILASPFSYVLPYLEILVGLMLILGLRTRLAAAASILLYLIFFVAKISSLIRGLDIEVCPCFGPTMPLHTVHSLILDLIFMIFAIHLMFYGSQTLALDGIMNSLKHPKIRVNIDT